MASRRSLVAFVALGLFLGACTRATTGETAPPDVFAPTPSIEGEPVPPTPPPPPDIDQIEIFPIGPRTLEALPGYVPIEMGDWTSGVSSANGRWLALYYGDDTGFNNGTRLLDVLAWDLVADWTAEDLQPVSVDDEGAVLAVDYRGTSPALARLTIGQARSERVAELSPNFTLWDRPRYLDDGRLLLMGPVYDATGAVAQVAILVVDESTASVTETALPGVRMGAAEIIDLGEGRTGVVDVTPALAWDGSSERALIVHADADVVTEVNLPSGETTDHRFGPTGVDDEPSPPSEAASGDLWTSTRRTAAISPDGRMLYIAGQVGEFTVREGAPVSVTKPVGLMVVDTATWEIVDRLDTALSELFMSPDGSRLIAAGYYYENSPTTYVGESSGLHLIDSLGLEVISHHEPEQSNVYYGPVSFSSDGGLGYVTTWVDTAKVVVIDLVTGEQITSRAGDWVQVFGEVGVMANSVDKG